METIRLYKAVVGLVLAACTVGFLIGGTYLPSRESDESTNQGQIRGRVLNPEGKPLASARVSLVGNRDSRWIVSSEVRSDSNGEFTFASPEWSMALAGQMSIVVESDGYGPGFASAHSFKSGDSITLIEPTELHAQFLKVDRSPVVNVTFQLRLMLYRNGDSFKAVFLPDSISERFSGTTGDDGSLVIKGLPRNNICDFSHNSPELAKLNYGQRYQMSNLATTQAQPTILVSAGRITGRVINSVTGEPVAGVPVHAQEAHSPDGKGGNGWDMVFTDQDGNFALGQMTAGNYNVNADLGSKWGQDWTCVAYDSLPVKAGLIVSGKDIKLIRGGLVVGTLKDSVGKPIANWHIGVYGPARPRSGAWVQSAITDQMGKYRIRVPSGLNQVYIMGGPGMKEDMSQQMTDVTVVNDKETTQNFSVEK